MRATHTIESIFGTRSRTAVLRVLHGVRVPLNASQVARQTRLSPPAATTALRELESMGLVRSSPVGRAWVYWLVRENAYVRLMVDAVFEAVDSMSRELTLDLERAFASHSVSVVLFGSYARGDQSADSDIDVALIAADKIARPALEEAADVESMRLRYVWGATISPLVYDLSEAAALGRTAPTLLAEIVRDGVTVCGMPPEEWGKHDESRRDSNSSESQRANRSAQGSGIRRQR